MTATTVPKLELNFFDDCSVAELAKKINLDLSGTLKPPKKSPKEPITDANNNPKEAIKTKLYTAHKFKCGSTLSGNQPFIADAMAEVVNSRLLPPSLLATFLFWPAFITLPRMLSMSIVDLYLRHLQVPNL